MVWFRRDSDGQRVDAVPNAAGVLDYPEQPGDDPKFVSIKRFNEVWAERNKYRRLYQRAVARCDKLVAERDAAEKRSSHLAGGWNMAKDRCDALEAERDRLKEENDRLMQLLPFINLLKGNAERDRLKDELRFKNLRDTNQQRIIVGLQSDLARLREKLGQIDEILNKPYATPIKSSLYEYKVKKIKDIIATEVPVVENPDPPASEEPSAKDDTDTKKPFLIAYFSDETDGVTIKYVWDRSTNEYYYKVPVVETLDNNRLAARVRELIDNARELRCAGPSKDHLQYVCYDKKHGIPTPFVRTLESEADLFDKPEKDDVASDIR